MAESFEVYRQNISDLARSLIIKFSYNAKSWNKALSNAGYEVDSDDPTTWKYYLNLAGYQHSFDEPIYIKSNDTQAEILLSKSVLENHPQTKEDYRPTADETYFLNLWKLYPNQEIFMRSVTTDLTVEECVNADDFTILYYDESLLDSNEVSLISDLQKMINQNVRLWWNSDFALTDPYYPAAFYASLLASINMWIDNIRSGKRMTSEVQNFWMWSYLGCFYKLDEFRNVLPRDTAIWLVKSVAAFQKKSSRRDEFDNFVKKLTNDLSLDVQHLALVVSTENLLNDYKREAYITYLDDNYDPDFKMSITEFMDKLDDYGIENGDYKEVDIANYTTAAESSIYNKIPLPYLWINETQTITNSSLETTLLKWEYAAYLASRGNYNPTYEFVFPNSKTRRLDTIGLYILHYYATNAANGVFVDFIPTFTSRDVVPISNPSLIRLRESISTTISDNDLREAISYKPNILNVTDKASLDVFLNSVAGYKWYLETKRAASTTQQEFSDWDTLIQLAFVDVDTRLGEVGGTFASWLETVQINRYDFSESDWGQIASDVYQTILDTNDPTSLTSRQSAAMTIIDRITSHKIRVVRGNNAEKTMMLDWGFPILEVEGFATTIPMDVYRGRIVLEEEIHPSTNVAVDIILPEIEAITDEAPTTLTTESLTLEYLVDGVYTDNSSSEVLYDLDIN